MNILGLLGNLLGIGKSALENRAKLKQLKAEQEFINLAKSSNLFPNQILRIKGTPESEVKRSLMEFSFIKSELKIKNLTIEISRHNYTKEYINLTKDFYLKM